MFCEYSKLVMLYKIGELHLRLLGTNGFHGKTKNGKFTVPCTFTALVIVRARKPKISCLRLADYVKKLH